MMARRGMMGLLAGGLSALMGGCGMIGHTYRYKLTVEVETPEGLRTGYAVRELTYSNQAVKLPDMAGVVTTQRGEAVAVDLPGGQTMFALLSMNGYETLQAAFGDDAPATLDAAEADGRVVELKPKPGSVPEQSGYPMLVRFRDLADPKSVEQVDPADLARSFGPGYRLARLTVQVIHEPVTRGIEKRLAWLDQLDQYRTDPANPFTNTLPSIIGGLRAGGPK